ncbi:MAG: ABC transporter substrate-binding protein [Clostridia bacterium]|nr:ABC transporter substrate-binding protein [Clostridia bacterium]
MKRWIAVILCLVMALSLVACGGGSATISLDDPNEEVTLKWLFGGSNELADENMVYEEFNKQLPNYLPNTQVEFETIPFADYAEKWKLLAASREKYDVVWNGWMLDYQSEIARGSYIELDALVDEYGKDLKAELPQWLLDCNRVGGKLYSIPCYQMSSLQYGVYVKKDVAEKYLDIEAAQAMINKGTDYTVEDFKVWEDFLTKAQAAGELGKGVSYSFFEYIMGYLGLPEGRGKFEFMGEGSRCAVFYDDVENMKVYDVNFDFPNNNAYYDLTADWYQKGFMRKDIISVQDKKEDEGKKNGNILWYGQAFAGEEENFAKTNGFEVIIFRTPNSLFIDHGNTTTNTAIATTSEHPARAMMLIDLMNTKKGADIYNLLTYGLEDVHYKKVSNNRIEWFGSAAPGSSSTDSYGYNKWVLGNTFNAYETQFDKEGWNDYILNEINGKAVPSPLMGFTLDTTPIQLELTQYGNIMKEYEYLLTGAVANYDEIRQERNAKLKEAGAERIQAEMQRQIDEWRKAVGK